MIADLKPYPVMRDSGVVWLGEVPNSWSILRGRQLFEIKKRIAGELGHQVISVTQEGLRVKDIASGEGQLSQDYSKYQTVEVGEFAMNSMDLLTGGVGIATSPGVTSPDYRVFSIRDRADCCDRYLLQVLRMLYWNRGFYAWGQGSAQLGRWRLPRRRFNDFPFPVPSFSEQSTIARFLDWTNGRLERAIRAKRKVIALLNEQKQAIIHRAVTRGLPSTSSGQATNVPLKPSDIPWLGDIPQHWEVISLRMRYSVELGKMLDAKRITGRHSMPYLRNRDVQWDRVLTDDLPVMDIPPSEIARYTVKRGDLLVCEGGEVGRSAFWDERLSVCGFQKALHRVRSLDGSRDYSRFFFYQMQVAAGRGVFSADGNENTFAHLTCEKLRRHRFVFPPFTEQKAVADHLYGELQQFQIATSRLEREIDLLREYRTRLVADVVTGKLDVREAAARLPDEAPLDTAEYDTDLSSSIEVAGEEAAV